MAAEGSKHGKQLSEAVERRMIECPIPRHRRLSEALTRRISRSEEGLHSRFGGVSRSTVHHALDKLLHARHRSIVGYRGQACVLELSFFPAMRLILSREPIEKSLRPLKLLTLNDWYMETTSRHVREHYSSHLGQVRRAFELT